MKKILPPLFFVCSLFVIVLVTSGCSKAGKIRKLSEKADAAYTNGELEEARILYLSLLGKDPQNARFLHRTGSIWKQEGSPLRALPYLHHAVELDPENTSARVELAELFVELRQLPSARREALAVLDRDPTHEKALRIAVSSSFGDQQLAEAEERMRHFDPRQCAEVHLAEATLHGRRGDFEAAARCLDKALQIDPASTEALLAKAHFIHSKGQTESAALLLKKASDSAGFPSAATQAYAKFLAQSGHIDEAIALINRQQQQARYYIPGWTLLANIHTANGEFDEALTCLDRVFGRDPVNPDALAVKALIFTSKGEHAKATGVYETLERAYPQSPLFKYQLALAHIQEGSDRKARIALDKAIEIFPDFSEAIMAQAQLDIKNQKYETAISTLEDMLSKRADHPRAQVLLAEAYVGENRLDDAASIFRTQIQNAPEAAGSHLMLGKVLRKKGDTKEARNHIEKANELSPQNLSIISELVELDLAGKDYDRAMKRVSEDFPGKTPHETVHLCHLRSQIEIARGNPNTAAQHLEHALEVMPDSITSIDNLVKIYHSNQNFDQAIRVLEEWLKREPSSIRHRSLLAMTYQEKGDNEPAIDQYQKVLMQAEDNVAALNNIAYLCSLSDDRMEEAKQYAEKALRIDPSNPAIKDTLGWILYRQGNYKEALRLIEAAAGSAPEHAEIQYHLGLARKSMGHFDKAAVALEKAATSPDPFEGKEDAKQQWNLLTNRDATMAGMTIEQLEKLAADNSGDFQAQIALANKYMENQEYENAKSAFTRVLETNPRHTETLKALARLHYEHLQDYASSLDYARKARDSKISTDPEVTRILGLSAFHEGKTSWAYGLMEEAVGAYGNDDLYLLSQLGWAAYRLGRVSEARQWMTRAGPKAGDFLAFTEPAKKVSQTDVSAILQKKSNFVPALMIKAASSPDADASEIYQQIIEGWPDFPLALKKLALIRVRQDKLDEARQLAIKADEILPDDFEVARCLGIIAYKRTDDQYAIRMLEKSIRLAPDDGETLVYLGITYMRAGNEAKGKEMLARAKQIPNLDQSMMELADSMME